MTQKELIEYLATTKNEAVRDLSYINGKHDKLVEHIAFLNGLIEELSNNEKESI